MEGHTSAGRPVRQGGAAVRLALVLGLVVALVPGLVGTTAPVDVTPAAHVPAGGTLDTTFDGDGIAITEIDSIVDPVDAAVQFAGGDERVLVLDDAARAIWRFLPDGTLDTTFDDDGVLRLAVPFRPTRIAANAGGSIAVAGFSGGVVGVRVAQLDGTGALNPSFGSSGTASVLTVTEPGGGSCEGVALDRTFTGLADVGVQSDGSIVVTGSADIEVDVSISAACETALRPGLLAVRLDGAGAVDAIGSHLPCGGSPEMADPRSLTITGDNDVFVSMAIQCPASPDPVEVIRMSPGLDVEMTGVSPFQPTEGQSFPVVVRDDGTVAVAARAATGGFEAWNLLRWQPTGDFIGVNTALFAPEIATTEANAIGLTSDGGFVVAGTATVGAGRSAIGLVRFGADGTPASPPTLVDHPGTPPTGLTATTLVSMGDGSHRLMGHADPEIFGLDSQRELLVTRLTAAGALDPAFGPDGNGFAIHHGSMGSSGQAVAVRPDNRVVVGGPITAPVDGGDRTGFVLQHEEGGGLDPGFAPEGVPGVVITRYDAPATAVESPAVVASGAVRAAPGPSVANGVPQPPVVAPQVAPTVDTETELRDAFADPDVTHITVTADISVSGGEIARTTATPLVIEGDGHVINRDPGTTGRIFFWDGAGDLTLNNLTLSGGDTTAGTLSGAAVDMDGSLTATNVTFSNNSAGGWGGAIFAGGTVTVTGSTFEGNSAGNGGGAIAAVGNLAVAESTFEENTAGPGDPVPDDPGGGGAIWVADGNARVDDSVFRTNQADHGGAIGVIGGVTLRGTTFEGNATTGTSFTTHHRGGAGGAVWARDGVEVVGGRFEDNRGHGGGAIAVFDDFTGPSPPRPVTATDVRFLRNAAVVGGAIYVGGPVTVTGSLLELNTATDGIGGAIAAWPPDGSSVSGVLRDTTFARNQSSIDGAAISNDGPLSIEGSTFLGNIDFGGSGGAVFTSRGETSVLRSQFIDNLGGAIRAGDSVVLTSSVFDSNDASEPGGAVHASQIVARDSRFTRNESDVDGGALHADDTVTLERMTFADNDSTDGSGGAVWGDTVSVDASLFDGNTAASDGGALAADGQITVVNSTFDGNDAGNAGGAITTFGGLDITYATVVGNGGFSQLFAEAVRSVGLVVAAPAGPFGEATNCADGTVIESSSFSYSTDGSCGFTGTGDTVNGSSPQLRSLANNGGPTQTRLPFASSPLTSAIPPAACDQIGVTVDQRGVSRPQGLGCEIGAAEVVGGLIDIQVEGLDLDSLDRTVIAGPTSSDAAAVHRLLPTGAPDPNFNDGFPVLFQPSGGSARFHDVVIDGAGRIVVVGELERRVCVDLCDEPSPIFGDQELVVVARLLADGQPDPAFGGFDGLEGIVALEPPPDPETEFEVRWESSGTGVAIDADGRVVITGWSQPEPESTERHLLVARFLDDGSGDGSFATHPQLGDGVRLGPADHFGEDLVTDGNDIVVVGTEITETIVGKFVEVTSSRGFAARFAEDGSIDTSFGTDGLAYPFPASAEEHSTARGVAIDPLGDVIIAGGSLAVRDLGEVTVADIPVDVLLARLLPTGDPDPLFGTNGVVASDAGLTVGEQATDVALAPDGKIVVAGFVTDDRGTRVLTARYNPGDAILDCTPNPADAGVVVVGESADVPVTCTALEGRARIDAVAIDPASEHLTDYAITTDGCTGVILPLNGTCEVTVTFTPGAVDARLATLTVEHTTVTGIKVPEVVDLVGEGIELPEFVATPDPVVFDIQQLGTISPSQIVTGTNIGGSEMTITDVAIVGANADDFALIATDCPSTSLDPTLDPGASCTVEVSFTPRAGSIGLRQARLQFVNTAPGSPHNVILRGQGGRAAGFTVEPDPIVFDPQRLGTTSPSQVVTGTNVGDFPLTITDVTPVGVHAADFTIVDTTCVGGLAPSGTCTVEIVFSPQSNPLTNRQALLRFEDTADGSPHVVRLRGTLLEPVIELDPAEGPIETEVTVTGEFFESGVEVQIRIGDVVIGTVPANQVDDGQFTIIVQIPEGTPGGPQAIVACQQCDSDRPIEAEAIFTVTPRLFVEPGLAPPGAVTHARGDGFPAETPIVLTWDRGIGRSRLITDTAGEFRVPILIFARDQLGQRELQATISESTEVVATTPFLVVPGTAQPRDFVSRR